VATCSPK